MNIKREWKINPMKGYTLLLRYLLSSFVIFLLPLLLFGLVAFNSAVNKLNVEVEASYIYKMEQIINDIEAQLDNVKINSIRMAYDPSLKPYNLSRSVISEIEAIQEIRKYKANVIIAEECILYFKDWNAVYTSSGKYINDIYFDTIVNFYNWNEILTDLDNAAMPFLRSQESTKMYGHGDIKVITSIYPISTNNTSIKNAVILHLITQKSLEDRVRNLVGDLNGELFVLNNENELVMHLFPQSSIQDNIYEQTIIEQFLTNGSSDILKYKHDAKPYTLFKAVSEQNEFTGILVLSTLDYLLKVNQYTKILKNVGFGALLIGIILIVIISFFNYRPIVKLLIDVKSLKPSLANDVSMNEIETISSVIRSTIDDNDSLIAIIEEQFSIIRNQVLTSILKGEYQSEIQEHLNTLQLQLQGPNFCVFAFSIVQDKNHGKYILKDDIIALIEKILSSSDRVVYGVELVYENHIAFICSYDKDNWQQESDITTNLIKWCEFNGIKSRIGVGNTYDSIQRIKHSYIEAVSALDYFKTDMNQQMVLFEDIVSQYSHFDWYPSKEIISFIQSLKQGDNNVAIKNLNDMMYEIKARNLSRIMEKYICYDIINIFIKAMNEVNIQLDPVHINTLTIFHSSDELHTNLLVLTQHACEMVNERINNTNNGVISQMIDYVNKNYHSYDISLAKVAEEFDMSISSLSKTFKEHMGIGFKEYIIKMRMEKAKNLLIESDARVGEIAEELGYANVSHFIKTFKSIEGLTPAQYKKSSK